MGIALRGSCMGSIMSAICLVPIILMNIDKYIKQIQSDLEQRHAGKNHA